MDILGIKEGTHVADIGAGSGWFTVRAAKRAGSYRNCLRRGHQSGIHFLINQRIQRDGIGNFHAILSEEDDPSCRKTVLILCCC